MKSWLIVPLVILSLTSLVAADPLALTVHTDQTTKTVSVGIYGQFLEHIFHSVHGGLWGDQILNGTLERASGRRGEVPRRRSVGGGHDRGGSRRSEQARSAPAPAPHRPRIPRGTGRSSATPTKSVMDRDNPFNAEVSAKLAAKAGSTSATGPGVRQRNIALKQGEKYTLSLYARGTGSVVAAFYDGNTPAFSKTLTNLTAQWQKLTVEFTASKTVDAASLLISCSAAGSVNVDQVSLFSASALATGGYRPDLMKAVADLRPASIRWPGGAFVGRYVWQDAVGPREKRKPYPGEIWSDRDTNQFGTDEFVQFCEKVGAEPIIVINTPRGVEDALNWLEYCMGDATTEYGKHRAANGHPAPYQLKTIEIDNEPDGDPRVPRHRQGVLPGHPRQVPQPQALRRRQLWLRTRPGPGQPANWDASLIEQAGKLFDIISPHYYNGIYVTADYVEDPYKYEQFLKTRGEIIKKSENPNIKVYVSEWNLTENRRGNDWRMGLYAGGILNAFERQADIVTMTCPALFLRKQGVTKDWDNALVNFDQKTWFPAGNYVVMKLWRDSFAPHLLAVDGPDHPLNFVATRSADKQTVFLKAVNPDQQCGRSHNPPRRRLQAQDRDDATGCPRRRHGEEHHRAARQHQSRRRDRHRRERHRQIHDASALRRRRPRDALTQTCHWLPSYTTVRALTDGRLCVASDTGLIGTSHLTSHCHPRSR